MLFFFTTVFRSKTPSEDDDDASSEAVSDPAGHSGMPRAKEMDTDGKDLKIVSLY